MKELQKALAASIDGDNWVKTYAKPHSSDAVAYAKERDFKFDDLISQFKSFYVLSSLYPTTPYYKLLLHRLTNCTRALKLETTKGALCQCIRDTFMHYTWCRHVHADGYVRGIIKKLPLPRTLH